MTSKYRQGNAVGGTGVGSLLRVMTGGCAIIAALHIVAVQQAAADELPEGFKQETCRNMNFANGVLKGECGKIGGKDYVKSELKVPPGYSGPVQNCDGALTLGPSCDSPPPAVWKDLIVGDTLYAGKDIAIGSNKLQYTARYTWKKGSGDTKMIKRSDGVCFLTMVRGQFDGPGEAVYATIKEDYWVLGGYAAEKKQVEAEAVCITGIRPQR